MKKNIVLLFIFITTLTSIAQTKEWSLSKEEAATIPQHELMVRKHVPVEYKIYNLKESTFRNKISAVKIKGKRIIEIPTLSGIKSFYIEESSNFSKELAVKYANITSYSGRQIDNNSIELIFSKGLDGYHFLIYEPGKPVFYVDSYTKNNKKFIAYTKNNLPKNTSDFTCEVIDLALVNKKAVSQDKSTNDGLLRTYRLAVATTGEYSQFQLNRLGISTAATTAVKKEAVLSAVNATITRVNRLFEKDLSVKFQLVANNDTILFLDASTDDLTNDNASTLLNDSQTKIDNVIGNANYDVGHTFSTGAGGLASLGAICITGQKAKGVTGIDAPFGDEFDIDFVAHEFGHQFGANHTFNGTTGNCEGGNRNDATAVEPGSGTTIMGYAGICGSQNIQDDSHDNFHSFSIAEMTAIISSSGNCATTSSNSNNAPIADAGLDYSIPKSTPFVLKGSASDVNLANVLTYNWEQIDNEVDFSIPIVSTNTGGAMFRALPSSISSDRFMPALTTVLSGNTASTWEVVPSNARDLNFSLTVRDNNAGGGSTARDDVTISVTDADAFTVTSQNTAITWGAGTSKTITWNKGTTDVAPISVQNVTIKLSEDGGLTFPIVLAENTPNDGTETITVPNNVTTQARIKIEAVGNIFYNVNAVNFEIESTLPSFTVANTSGNLSACNSGNQSAVYTLNIDFINGFTETVSLSATGQPAGSSVTFSPASISADGNVTMTIANLDGKTPQTYTINIVGSANTVTQNINVNLKVTAATFGSVTLIAPVDNQTDVDVSEELRWVADVNASNYDVEIATDSSFLTVISNDNVATNSYTPSGLSGGTTYFWRVKPKNSCGEGALSNTYSFTTLNPSYCDATFIDDAGGAEHITNVTYNTINNNSGNDTTDGYEDFTTVQTNVKRGEEYQISVTLDTAGFQDQVYVFIDWNRDFVFDKNTERYDLGIETTNVGTKIFNITVPNDAVFGSTRMRVIIEYTAPGSPAGDGPCDSDQESEWGETEDYTIIVDNTAAVEDIVLNGFNLYPNPTKGEFTLNLEVANTKEVTIQLFDVRGRLIDKHIYQNTGIIFSEKIFFEKASTGLYLLKIFDGEKQITTKLVIE